MNRVGVILLDFYRYIMYNMFVELNIIMIYNLYIIIY